MCLIEKYTDVYPMEIRTRTVIRRCLFSDGRGTCDRARVYDRGEFYHVRQSQQGGPRRMTSPRIKTIVPRNLSETRCQEEHRHPSPTWRLSQARSRHIRSGYRFPEGLPRQVTERRCASAAAVRDHPIPLLLIPLRLRSGHRATIGQIRSEFDAFHHRQEELRPLPTGSKQMTLLKYLVRLDHNNRHESNDLLGNVHLLLNVSQYNADHVEV